MKNFLPALFLFFLLIGCKNGEKNSPDPDFDSGRTFTETESDTSSDTSFENNSNTGNDNNNRGNEEDLANPDKEISSEDRNNQTANKTAPLTGNFIKVGEENDTSCSCYCLEVVYNTPSEMCLTPDKMYITVNYKKGSGNIINVHLTDPSPKNTEGTDIPWKDFDRTVPIATLSPRSNGEMDLDWLGFTINGDLAMDYALYGKKTLEGQYRQK